jgi:hypothetical protein
VPTTSIDGFFACTLLVTVALIVLASFAGAMQTSIQSQQGANDQSYLKTAAETLVTSVGSPANWGSSGTAPTSFGLAKTLGQTYELDIDKITRLNSQYFDALPYDNVSKAARLYNLAFRITVTQILTITIQPTSNTTNGQATTYNYQVSTTANLEPAAAAIQCYIIQPTQISSVQASTSSSGQGTISFTLPNSDAGQVLLAVFAKANLDERLTAYQTYAFTHISGGQPQQTLSLSALDNQLTVNITQPETTVNHVYAISFGHQSQLSKGSNGNYPIPSYLDKSPILLVATGSSQTEDFTAWTSYPNVPLTFGSNFANTEQNTFAYTVSINDVLYRLTVTLGELAQ